MKASDSSARLTFRKFIQTGAFVLLVVVLGLGAAVGAAVFVVGDLSGAWQTEKVAGSAAAGQKLVPVRFVAPALRPAVSASVTTAASLKTSAVPPPLVAASENESAPEIPVARATPVLPDVPVLRARLVLAATARTFDARAEVADDQFVPRARPVSRRELGGLSDRPYGLPASSNVAQRGPVALNW